MYSQNYNNYMRNFSVYNPYANMYMGKDLERMYPDSYRVVYPMVVAACNNITMPVTEEMVDKITDDIYDRVEADGRINTGAETEFVEYDSPTFNNIGRRPRRRNRFFRDFIRVLLLRELLH